MLPKEEKAIPPYPYRTDHGYIIIYDNPGGGEAMSHTIPPPLPPMPLFVIQTIPHPKKGHVSHYPSYIFILIILYWYTHETRLWKIKMRQKFGGVQMAHLQQHFVMCHRPSKNWLPVLLLFWDLCRLNHNPWNHRLTTSSSKQCNQINDATYRAFAEKGCDRGQATAATSVHCSCM